MGGGAFAHGQTYVALSRCRSLEGLFLASPIRMEDIIVDPAVLSFMGVKRAPRNTGSPNTSTAQTTKTKVNETITSSTGLTASEKNRLQYFVHGPQKYAMSEKGRLKVTFLFELVPKMSTEEKAAFTVAYKKWKDHVESSSTS
jgi:hypothetical protein